MAVDGFDDLLLDEAHSQLFVSQGLDAGPIVVTDLDGSQTTTLAGTEDSRRVTLSHDGSTLWVPLPRANEVVGFDTATLTETSRHALPSDVCPGSIAPTTDTLLAVTALGKEHKGFYDLMATLDQPADGVIVITATPTGGAPEVVASGSGPLAVRVAPSTTTTYVASYAGDVAYEPSTATMTIEISGGKGRGKPKG